MDLAVLRRGALATLATLTLACSAAEVPAVDTFGPGKSFDSGLGWGVGGGSADGPTGANYEAAGQFQAAATGTLSSIELPMWRLLGSSQFTINLRADNAGTPGNVLASTTATAPDQLSVISASFASGTSVQAGNRYWISLATVDPSAALWWSFNSVGAVGSTAFSGATWQQPGDWFIQEWTIGAMRVGVSAVPEPASGLLLVAGLVPLLALRRRSRHTL